MVRYIKKLCKNCKTSIEFGVCNDLNCTEDNCYGIRVESGCECGLWETGDEINRDFYDPAADRKRYAPELKRDENGDVSKVIRNEDGSIYNYEEEAVEYTPAEIARKRAEYGMTI